LEHLGAAASETALSIERFQDESRGCGDVSALCSSPGLALTTGNLLFKLPMIGYHRLGVTHWRLGLKSRHHND
jgi:hypothetical protein